jgi:hypothetical protein
MTPSQLKTYQAEIPQEDGTDITETVDEAKNLVQVKRISCLELDFRSLCTS